MEGCVVTKHTLRCAVVGAGRIAWGFHLPQICMREGFELAAVADPDSQRLEEVKHAFHPAAVFTDLETMLKEARPDLTVIASPTIFHKEQALLAFRYGSDVFCDKPVGLNLKEASAMYGEAKRLGRKLMAYQPHRINSEGLTARAILQSGKLGRIYLIERHISNYVRRNDWQAFSGNGGGMLLNYGSHYIDQLLYLTHDTTARAKCELRRVITCGDADDLVKAMITTKHGILLELDINQATAYPFPEWRICGTRGSAVYSDRQWSLRYYEPDALPPIRANHALAAAGRRYPSEQIEWKEESIPCMPSEPGRYYDCCRDYFAGDSVPLVLPEETLEVVRTIELCRRDAEGQEFPSSVTERVLQAT